MKNNKTKCRCIRCREAGHVLRREKKAPKAKIKKLQQKGVHILIIDTLNGRIDLKQLMKESQLLNFLFSF